MTNFPIKMPQGAVFHSKSYAADFGPILILLHNDNPLAYTESFSKYVTVAPGDDHTWTWLKSDQIIGSENLVRGQWFTAREMETFAVGCC